MPVTRSAIYTSRDRPLIIGTALGIATDELGVGVVARKSARIVAVKIAAHFAVQTEHGLMTGEPGDWLATNHPMDDPGSDVWPISAERFAATYEIEPGEA